MKLSYRNMARSSLLPLICCILFLKTNASEEKSVFRIFPFKLRHLQYDPTAPTVATPTPTVATPTPETTPAPTSETTPAPTPETTPAPTSETTPAPTSETTPALTSETTPAPTSQPTPALTPDPTPAPTSETTPAPTPTPTTNVTPGTTPTPTTNVTPSPTPTPTTNATPGTTPTSTTNVTPGPTPTSTTNVTPGPTPTTTDTPPPTSTTTVTLAPTSTITTSTSVDTSPPTATPIPTLIVTNGTDSTPSPTVSYSENSFDSNSVYSLSFKSYLESQPYDEFSLSIWSAALSDALAGQFESVNFTIQMEEIIIEKVYSRFRKRLLKTYSENIYTVYTLNSVSGSYAYNVTSYLTQSASDDIITAYNSEAQSSYDSAVQNSNGDSLSSTSIVTVFTDYVETSSDDGGSSSSSSSTGIIVGIVVAVVAILLMIGLYFYIKRQKKRSLMNNQHESLDFKQRNEWAGNNVAAAESMNLGNDSMPDADISTDREMIKFTDDPNAAALHTTGAVKAIATGLNQLGISLPFVGPMVVLCAQLVLLYDSKQSVDDNCKEIVRWSKAMEHILRNLDAQCQQCPELRQQISMESMQLCEEKIQELVYLSEKHSKSNFLVKFALSSSTKQLINDATKAFDVAVSTLDLSVATAALRVNMKIDRDMNFLLMAVDGMQVQLAKVLEEVTKAREYSPDSSFDRKTAVYGGDSYESESYEESIKLEDGRTIDNALLRQMTTSLNMLEISPEEIVRVQQQPIGSGGFSKIFLVEFHGIIRAAKVVPLNGLSTRETNRVYTKFSKELYMLSSLQHPRVVELIGCVSTITELTIVLEYMKRGSLRAVFGSGSDWRDLDPRSRYAIIVDILDGLKYLHGKKIAHRDLKSANILITDDFRGKLTDFGLSKTTSLISSVTKSTFMGGTLAWLAPEGFDAQPSNAFKSDMYSFGILLWEILSGILGPEKSIPWAGLTDPQIMRAVIMGERPQLLPVCIDDANVLQSSVILTLMNVCLSGDPNKRPTAQDALLMLRS